MKKFTIIIHAGNATKEMHFNSKQERDQMYHSMSLVFAPGEIEKKEQDINEQTNIIVRIETDLKERFQIRCIENKTTMTDVLIKSIEKYLE